MTTHDPRWTQLSDEDLLRETLELAATERTATPRLVAVLAEVDKRRLYLALGYSSLFVYCTRVLHLSEHAAYGRIEAARAARRFPALLELLERGDLTLTTVALLAPVLTDANQVEVVARARHCSKREVEEILASVRPRPDVPPTIRRVPTSVAMQSTDASEPSTPQTDAAALAVRGDGQAGTSVPPPRSAAIQPLAPERYKLQLTIGRATENKLRRARDLMRHVVPSGELAMVLDRALDALLKELERDRCGAASRPRAAGAASRYRHIPAAVRRAVWERDDSRCAFRGAHGRCGETSFLEFHHVRAYVDGGPATVENIELRCRAHNQYEAELLLGEPLISRERVRGYCVNSVRTERTGHNSFVISTNSHGSRVGVSVGNGVVPLRT